MTFAFVLKTLNALEKIFSTVKLSVHVDVLATHIVVKIYYKFL